MPPANPASHISDSDNETLDDKLRDQAGVTAVTKGYLFVVFEGARPLAGGARYALEGVDEIVIGRGSERAATLETRDGVGRLALWLDSPLLSRLHARLRREPEGWLVEDGHSRNGSYLNGKRIARGRVGQEDVLEVGHVFLMVRYFVQRLDEASSDLDSATLEGEPSAFRTLVPPVAARLADLGRVARSAVSILLSGETGTGKEVLARSIHELSGRRGPFVAVNCSTLTEGLAESQLFGHVRGAFSGAIADSVGFVRAAEGGTLMLDEVADLRGAAQGALLRVLQEREVTPVGRPRPQSVDVRFIATTPQPLENAIEQDRFRSDLFARLSGFVHAMTPLRERPEDLGLLAAALLRKAGAREADRLYIPPAVGLTLLRHTWPLNVRELEQALVRSRLLNEDGVMKTVSFTGKEPAAPRSLSPGDQELRQRLIEALAAARGNVSEAARALGIGRMRAHRTLRRLKINPRSFGRQE
jgi:DNA-binding NtrC family response regulator